MKVIDAVWEKRNLGIDACEVLFEREDAVADISSEFERISAPYTVVKVPSERNDISEYVQKNGTNSFKLTFEEIQNIAGIPIDHSFLKYKKELTEYGYEVGKISMKEQTVLFNKLD